MIASEALKIAVEDRVGTALRPALFDQVEERARQKLDRINNCAGRSYGEDGYGDEYLVILAVEAVREMALSVWCNTRKGASV